MNQEEVLYRRYKMVDQIKRHTAYKVRIKDIIDSKYIKGEGEWSPNYLELI